MPQPIDGYVLQKPVDAEKGDVTPLWIFVRGDVIRVPIFRYELKSDDPDYLALVAMRMLEQINELEVAMQITNPRQRIMLRKTDLPAKFLYMGIILRLV